MTEKEFLALVFAFEKFRPSLIGSHINVLTDHASLKHLLLKREAKSRLVRWMLLLHEFDCEVRDMKDSENPDADHLSRIVHARDTEAPIS